MLHSLVTLFQRIPRSKTNKKKDILQILHPEGVPANIDKRDPGLVHLLCLQKGRAGWQDL